MEDTTVAKRVILEQLDEQPHPELVENVIFWALEHYAKRGQGTWGETIASAIIAEILDEEKTYIVDIMQSK